jgi:hypothetical protein
MKNIPIDQLLKKTGKGIDDLTEAAFHKQFT